MADYISRQRALRDYQIMCYGMSCAECEFRFKDCSGLCKIEMFLMDLPSEDVEEVRHGRWVEENPLDAPNCRLIKCSECGKSFIVPTNVPYEDWIDGRNYCYVCGAKMGGEQTKREEMK